MNALASSTTAKHLKDHRKLKWVITQLFPCFKENNFTAATQVKNRLAKVARSVWKPAIKRCLGNGYTQKQRLNFTRRHVKELTQVSAKLFVHINPNLSAKATQESQDKEMWYLSIAKSVTWYHSNRACYSITEHKTEAKETHKQVKVLQSILRKRSMWSGPCVLHFYRWLPDGIFTQVLKTIIAFHTLLAGSVTSQPLKMGDCLKRAFIPK